MRFNTVFVCVQTREYSRLVPYVRIQTHEPPQSIRRPPERLTPRFWWHNPRHIGIFSDAQANDIDNAHIEATMGTGQEPSERGIGAGSWLHERSQELQRLASQARYMGATTDKGTQRRERTMEHSPEPQCEPSRKRHQAESATRGRPSRPRAAIRRLPDGLLGRLVDVAGWLSERHREPQPITRILICLRRNMST